MGREVKRVKEYLAGECYESIRRPKSPCRFRMIPQVSTNLYIFGMVRVHGPWCHRYSKSKTLSATCWAHGAGMAQDISSYAQMQQAAKLVQHNPKIAQKWDDHEDLLVKRCSWSLVHWPNQQQKKVWFANWIQNMMKIILVCLGGSYLHLDYLFNCTICYNKGTHNGSNV